MRIGEPNSRELVLEAMRGAASRIPVYFWLADPELEASVGDVIGIRCWFKCFDFDQKGGPFAKLTEARQQWCDRLEPDAYEWPTFDALATDMDQIVAEVLKVDKTKSFQLEFIGPTENSETSCASAASSRAQKLGQTSHRFDFSVLTVLAPDKADTIHRRFFNLLMGVIERATEYEAIDFIRIADDFCGYGGSLYRPDFTQTIVERQIELGRAVVRGGKHSILHADGDLRQYLHGLANAYSGFHPLDIMPKSSVHAAQLWASGLEDVRRLLPNSVLFTGIPIDLLCNREVSSEELVGVVKYVIKAVGQDRLVLTTTHRPYPGWSYGDFEQKAFAVKQLIQSLVQ